MILLMSKFNSTYALIGDSSPFAGCCSLSCEVITVTKNLLVVLFSLFSFLFSFSFSCTVFGVYCTLDVHAGSYIYLYIEYVYQIPSTGAFMHERKSFLTVFLFKRKGIVRSTVHTN